VVLLDLCDGVFHFPKWKRPDASRPDPDKGFELIFVERGILPLLLSRYHTDITKEVLVVASGMD